MASKPRTKKCWIVEIWTKTRGWEPSLASQVNATREWAERDMKVLSQTYRGARFRVKRYEQEVARG